MKTIKVSEVTGAVLDWLVAKAEGANPNNYRDKPRQFGLAPGWRLDDGFGIGIPKYSTDWSQGGPIIERERIKLSPTIHGTTWTAQFRHTESHPLVSHPVLCGWTNRHGPTALIAAMRCYVASKLGDTVEVPEELE